MRWFHVVYRALARLLVVGVLAQFYLAGLAVFGVTRFAAHAQLGYVLVLVALLVFGFAVPSRPTAEPAVAGLVLLLTMAQPVLAMGPRNTAPAVSAIHTVTAALVLIAAVRLALGRPAPAAAAILSSHGETVMQR